MQTFPYQAVFFDFDGTLADGFASIAASVNHVRATYGLSPLEVGDVQQFVGLGPEFLLENTVPGCHVEKDLRVYRAHYGRVMVEGTTLLPGAMEVLHGLKALGRRIGLCSNKPRLFSQDLLQHLNVRSFFDVIVGPEDVPRPKPAPDMLHLAMRRLQVSAAEVLYVGDMTVDIETARAAGVTVWIVATGSQTGEMLRAAHPDRMLTGLREILVALDRSPSGAA